MTHERNVHHAFAPNVPAPTRLRTSRQDAAPGRAVVSGHGNLACRLRSPQNVLYILRNAVGRCAGRILRIFRTLSAILVGDGPALTTRVRQSLPRVGRRSLPFHTAVRTEPPLTLIFPSDIDPSGCGRALPQLAAAQALVDRASVSGLLK